VTVRTDRPPAQGRGAGRAVKLGLGIAISALFLWAVLRTVSLEQVGQAIAASDLGWILAALGFVLLAYLLKIQRWTVMLRNLGADVGIRQTAAPFVGGVAFNNVLPFRAGDLLRVVAFQRFTGVPRAGQLGTLVLERLLDLFTLMLILFATLTLWRIDLRDTALLDGLRLAAFAVAAGIMLFLAAPAPIRIAVVWGERVVPRLKPLGEAFLRLSEAVQRLSRPLLLLRLSALSLLAWLAEGGVFYAAARALDLTESPAAAALLALSVGTLSTIIPSSPGYVGTFHFFTARMVTGLGATAVGAAAYAILVHAILWVTTTAAGFLLLGLSGFRARPDTKERA
jgi:uncharacterized protein (TIRG00374 family)